VNWVKALGVSQRTWAKTLCELAQAGVRPEQIRRNLEQLQRWLPVEQPLAQLVLLEQDGQLLVRLEDGQLAEPTGACTRSFSTCRPATTAWTSMSPS
jgi:hypothetical protein